MTIAGALYRSSLRAAVALAFAVAVLGATVRLADAGLGCPDWPGCYGSLTVSGALSSPPQVLARWPDRPLHPGRARIEMLHRYAAGALGLLVLWVAAAGWGRPGGRLAGVLLLGLLTLQVLLGMWTVTWGLMPATVSAHLIGGMALLATLWWLALEDARSGAAGPSGAGGAAGAGVAGPRALALACLALLAVQIALGGLTSSSHAGLVCQGFPTCNGHWWPGAGLAAGLAAGLGGGLDGAGLLAIHQAHRLGALAVFLGLCALLWASRRARVPVRRAGVAVAALLVLQIGLGIGNVLAGLPLPLAAAHNAVAALLLLAVLTLNHRLARGGPLAGETP